MISIVNTECHVPKTFSDLAKIAAWGRLGLLKKNQGEEVGIFVAKDFNFADVYNLELRR